MKDKVYISENLMHAKAPKREDRFFVEDRDELIPSGHGENIPQQDAGYMAATFSSWSLNFSSANRGEPYMRARKKVTSRAA